MELARAAFVLVVFGIFFALVSLGLRHPAQQSARNLARTFAAICLAIGAILAVVGGGIHP
jgi:hypothetical protein